MSQVASPTLRAQCLGKLLRDLRDAAGLTLRDAGDHIMRDPSTISRIEAGTLPVRLPDIRELLNLYGVHDPAVRSGLENLTRDVWRKGWWDGYADSVPNKVVDVAWLEARAEHIKDFGAAVLPGLLQTADYAEAVIRAAEPEVGAQQLRQWVDFRMKRQDVLNAEDGPHYTAILDEACLQRAAGGAAVMRDQLAHLLDVAHRPNATIRVLPFSTGALPSPEGAFTLFVMPTPFPLVAQINSEAGAIYLEAPMSREFDDAFARIERDALDIEESRTFLKTRLGQLA